MNKLFAALLTAWNWMTDDVKSQVEAGKFNFTEAQIKELTTAGTTISTLKTEKKKAEDDLTAEKDAHVKTAEKLTKAESDLAEAKTKIETLEKAKAGITVSITDKKDKLEGDKKNEFETSFDREKKAMLAEEKID